MFLTLSDLRIMSCIVYAEEIQDSYESLIFLLKKEKSPNWPRPQYQSAVYIEVFLPLREKMNISDWWGEIPGLSVRPAQSLCDLVSFSLLISWLLTSLPPPE